MSLRRTTTTTTTTTTAGVNSAENLKKSRWKRAVFALNPLTQWFPKLHRLVIPLPFVQQDCQFCRNDIIYYVLWSFEARVVFVSMWSGRWFGKIFIQNVLPDISNLGYENFMRRFWNSHFFTRQFRNRTTAPPRPPEHVLSETRSKNYKVNTRPPVGAVRGVLCFYIH